MTNRAERILKYIKNYIRIHGYAPTRREIGHACGMSTSVVSYWLNNLQDQGHLTITKDIARGIVLVDAAKDADWLTLNALVRK